MIAVRKLDKFKYLNFNNVLKTIYRKDIDKNTKPANYSNLKLYVSGKGLLMKRNDLERDIRR
jgi:hypothetical protein